MFRFAESLKTNSLVPTKLNMRSHVTTYSVPRIEVTIRMAKDAARNGE